MQTKITVTEPNHLSEFEIHAWVWSEIRKFNINARGEIKTLFPDKSNKRSSCRFDIAIFVDKNLTGIIEIKAGKTKHKTAEGWSGTRQGKRYLQFGVPVAIIYGKESAENFIADMKFIGTIPWDKFSPIA